MTAPPQVPSAPASPRPPTALRAVQYLRPWRRSAALATAGLALQSLLTLVPALLARSFTKELTRSHPHVGRLVALAAGAGAATLMAAVLGVVVAVIVAHAVQSAMRQLRRELFDHLLRQTVDFYTRNRGGELISRLMNDVGGIAIGLTGFAPTLLRGAVTAVAALAVMAVLSWQLTLVTVAVLPLFAVGLRLVGGEVYRARRGVQEQLGDLNAFAQETLGISGVMLVRSYGRGGLMRNRFAALTDELRRREIAVTVKTQRLILLGDALLVVSPTAIVIAGSYLVAHHLISLSSFVGFGAVALIGLGPALSASANSLAVLLGSRALWGRVFEVLDAAPTIVEHPDARELVGVRGEVEIADVSFSYPGQPRPALTGLSLVAQPGRLVAVVGPSGAGKTTLAGLIARLIDPDEGHISIDGQDIRGVTLSSLSDVVGFVFQDAFLFHASIRENLLVGRPEATEAELAAAVASAHLTEVIARLPDGYETVVGERGHRFSGGERQRIAMARAILKDPPILILDEATSHLDSASEQLVQSALSRLFHGRTSFVIAHRLSTVLAADLIVVLSEGRLVESGTHEELLELHGLYAHLYELQLGSQPSSS